MSHTRRKVLGALGGTVALAGCSALADSAPSPAIAETSIEATGNLGKWTVTTRQSCTEAHPAVIEIAFENTTDTVGRFSGGNWIPFTQLGETGADERWGPLWLNPALKSEAADRKWKTDVIFDEGMWHPRPLPGTNMAAYWADLQPGETLRRRYQLAYEGNSPPPAEAHEFRNDRYSFKTDDEEAVTLTIETG